MSNRRNRAPRLKRRQGLHKLILTSDDYGFSPEVNKGILKAVELGTISCVNVLMNLASEEDVRELAKTIHAAGNRCGIGLHLNTNSGPSVLNKKCTLTENKPREDGKYYFREMVLFNYEKTNSYEVAEELWAQFNKLKAIIGGDKIDCISSHYNIHVFSDIYLKIVIKIAKTHNIPMRSPVRWVTRKQHPKLKKYNDGKAVMPITARGAKLATKLERSTYKVMSVTLPWKARQLLARRGRIRKAGLKHPNNLAGHWLGQPSFRAISWLYHQLIRTGKNNGYCSEILMHLSSSAEPSKLPASYEMSERYKEFKIITSDEVVEFCQPLYNSGPVRLGSFRKLLLEQDVNYDLG